MERSSRKLEHLHYALQLQDGPGDTGYDDVQLLHNCLPDLDLSEVNLAIDFFGHRLRMPIIINAITGGAPDVLGINKALAGVARDFGLAMAVGSQTAALEDPELASTFKVVREENPHGMVLANVGAYVHPGAAVQAVEMIQANALQIHLNVAQELMMREGDRCFKSYLHNIEKIVKKVKVPVIVKEVGCGIARGQARQLFETGIAGIDIGGKGGTNFIAIEAARKGSEAEPDLLNWGIPTVASLVEVHQAVAGRVVIIASGGVRSASDIIKSLVLGAKAVGIAGWFLKLLLQQDEEVLRKEINGLAETLRMLMLLIGAGKIELLPQKPCLIFGRTGEWLKMRGIDLTVYASR